MTQPPETYPVPCFHCHFTFDAVQAVWCGCISLERTLVCPVCGKCFCTATPGYRTFFWSNAPDRLREKRTKLRTAEVAARPPMDPKAVKHPLVLVVDDDADVRRVAVRSVESLGYHAIAARDGWEGLQSARKYRPELVLSDALMPEMDGRKMCKLLKSDPATAEIKVVVLSGLYTRPQHRSEAFKEFQVDDYLAKPIDYRQLKEVLRKFLG